MKKVIVIVLTVFVSLLSACGDSDLAAVKTAACKAKELQKRTMELQANVMSGKSTTDDLGKIMAESAEIGKAVQPIYVKHLNDADWNAKATKVVLEACN